MILVKQVREAKGMSQVELARLSHIKQQSISLIETGVSRNPGIETLNALAVALGCTVTDLYRPDPTEGGAEG
jgi:transcriptional regulator with XRE-family HTH domain